MNILVTGGTGYLGRKIVKELLKCKNKVIILSINPHVDLYNDEENVLIYSTSKDGIENAFRNNIDCVLHLATLYGRNNEEIEEIIDANVIFPTRVIECAIKNNVKYFFSMDTAIQDFVNMYAITKFSFKQIGKNLGENGKIRFINMKSEHFYGPFDSDVKFIANMLKKFRSNIDYVDTTMGEQERAFIYIDDLVDAIKIIIEYESKNEKLDFTEYEIGPNQNISIKNALLIMKELTNSSTEIRFGKIPYRINEVMKSECNNKKLKSIGWKQKISCFEDGINKILEEEKYEGIN